MGGWAYHVPAAERSDTLLIPGFVVGLIGVLISAIPLLMSLSRRASIRPGVETLAVRLAEAVDGE